MPLAAAIEEGGQEAIEWLQNLMGSYDDAPSQCGRITLNMALEMEQWRAQASYPIPPHGKYGHAFIQIEYGWSGQTGRLVVLIHG